MRLLNVQTYKLHTFYGDKIPKYAILSHTWLQDHEEVTFNHIENHLPSSWDHLPGARKLKLTCRQAIADDYSWVWIDTCCIDKANSSELSEAINSMFMWYKKAAVCYAYLMDFDCRRQHSMLGSRWWTRAWTLQELLAPESVQFFDTRWRRIGTKADMAEQIAKATNIDIDALRSLKAMYSKSVAQRLSWAARREATRAEDLAYSLLGIFKINMAMLYGEGNGAFLRLQKEIMHTSDDLSIFAWAPSLSTLQNISASDVERGMSHLGMFAPHPSKFENCKNIEFFSRHIGNARVEEQHGNLTLHAPVISYKDHRIPHKSAKSLPPIYWIALLPCGLRGKPHVLFGLLLSAYHQIGFSSDVQLRSIRDTFRAPDTVATFLVETEHIVKANIMRIRVDSWSTMSLFQTAGRATAVRRILNIKCATSQVSEPKVLGVSRWSIIKKSPYVLSQDGKHDGSDIVYPLCLQFSTRTQGLYLHVLVCVKANSNDKDHIVVWDVSEAAPDMGTLTSTLALKPNHAKLHLPGEHRVLFAKVETRIVYNQAVSLLTIKERSVSQDQDSDDSAGSAVSDRAVLARPS